MPERLEAVIGSMFAGKTDELVRKIERAEIAGLSVQVFKPAIDDRYEATHSIKSHSGAEHEAVAVALARDIILQLKPETKLVVIDEAQFFDPEIVDVIGLITEDKPVIVAGLAADFKNEPFGSMPVLIAKADEVTRLTAICTHSDNGDICGAEATRTQRLIDGEPANWDSPVVLVGGSEAYAARCVHHHMVPGKPTVKLE